MDDILNYRLDVVAHITANTLIQELKRHGMLQLEKTAFERTKDDVKFFKAALELLSNDQVPQSFKKQIAIHSTNMQRALKRLKAIVKEQDFIFFYQFNLNSQTYRRLAVQFEVDEKTVARANTKCLRELSALTYPEIFMAEILN